MKLLKIFLTLSLCFLFCDDTILKKDTNKSFKENFKDFKISGYIGQISPITSSDRSSFNPGLSLGIGFISPKNIKIFKQSFDWGLSFESSNMKGNTSDNKKTNSTVLNLITQFKNIPLKFKLGLGISDDSDLGYTGSGILDIMHNIPNDKLDVSIGIRMHQIFNVTDNWEIEHAHGLYGLNIIFGHKI